MFTTGLGVGRYTAVVVSDTAITWASLSAGTPGSATCLTSGWSSSLSGRSRVSRSSGCWGHDSITDTADGLAAADTRRHSGCAGTSGLILASSAP